MELNSNNYKKTNNIIYNILNYDEPSIIFNYGIFLIIIIFIFSKINFNINILIGLLFFSIISYYFYTYKEINTIGKLELKKNKFNSLYTKSKILEKYPDIVDILFYMEEFKNQSISIYNELIKNFENFCKIYEYCTIDYKLIYSYYSTLTDIKINILFSLNSFIFSSYDNYLETKINNIKISTERTLNKLLNNLVIINKKKLYYNGYNNTTKLIDYSNIVPSNIVDNINYLPNSYNISNLLYF